MEPIWPDRNGRHSTMIESPYSVFLVEDETMIRMMLVEMLEELGQAVAAEAGLHKLFT